MRLWMALAALCAWGATANAGSIDSVATRTFGWKELLRDEEPLLFTPEAARLPLQHRFVQFGSEVLRDGDSTLVRNRDYGIDYGRGIVFLLEIPTQPLPLTITYLHLPGPPRRSYRAADITSRDSALALDAPTLAGPAPLPAPGAKGPVRDLHLPPTLQLSGSKSIGVSFGPNRDASIDQSLHVEASGDLGEDLQVNAVLADDNLPVRPEGNTEDLGDLSKVFLEMQGPVVGGVLGDYTLAHPRGEFVHFQRELRGGELRLRFGDDKVAIGAGLAKGELVTQSFRGVEGKQGPYDLLSVRRLDASTVLPGTEKIHLDGELLRRGDNQDYVIDYDRGELRFTSRRRITADSEIGVEFQLSAERYRRDTRLARFEGNHGKVQLQGLLFEEGDVRDRPVGSRFGPAEVAALEAAGDHPAVAPGVRVVGPGKGQYRYNVDSTQVIYDPRLGDLDVSFYEIGARRGSYADSLDLVSGRRFFYFAGVGGGPFAIGRLLTLPSRMRIASGRLEAEPWRGAHLVGEGALSAFDANLFSQRDDADNRGAAIDLDLDAGQRTLGRAGQAGIAFHVSQLAASFHAPGRTRPAFYYKEWNAEQDSLRGRERLAETTLRYGLGGEKPWLRLSGNVGRLDRGSELVTDRGQVDVALGRAADRGIEARVQQLDTQRAVLGADAGRTRHFAHGGARYRIGWLVPEMLVESDEFVRADVDSVARPSFRYLDLKYRLGLRASERATAALEFGRRDTDARRTSAERAAGFGEWQSARRNDTYTLTLFSRPAPSLNTEVALSRRTNEPAGASLEAATRSDLARLVVGWNPPRRARRSELRYEVTDDAVRTLQQVLVLAPDGKGDFDAEGRPVGKDQGLYDKVFRFSGAAERVKQVEASLRVELGGLALGGTPADSTQHWWRRNVSLVQIVSVREQTRGDRLLELYLLQPSALQTGQTLFGNVQARQDWSFLNASTRHALKLFLSGESELDGRFSGAQIQSRRGQATLRYDRSGLERWSVGAESGLGWRQRRGPLDAVVPGRPSSDTFRVAEERLLGRVAYRLSPSERLELSGEWVGQDDRLSRTRQQLWTVAPTATLAPVRNLRLYASVAATRVRETKLEDVAAPFFFDAPGTKTTSSVTGSYRLGQNLNLNLTYSGIRNTDGRSTYDVKAETRAIF